MYLRIASILILIWAAVQGYLLLMLGGSSHAAGWLLCLIAVLLALSLLTGHVLARIAALVASVVMLSVYGWVFFRFGAPSLSVAWSQPALAMAVVAVLIKLPGNNSLEGIV